MCQDKIAAMRGKVKGLSLCQDRLTVNARVTNSVEEDVKGKRKIHR